MSRLSSRVPGGQGMRAKRRRATRPFRGGYHLPPSTLQQSLYIDPITSNPLEWGHSLKYQADRINKGVTGIPFCGSYAKPLALSTEGFLLSLVPFIHNFVSDILQLVTS